MATAEEHAEHRRQMDEIARKNSDAWRARKAAEAADAEAIQARLLAAVNRGRVAGQP
jgi:hypothetical protein